MSERKRSLSLSLCSTDGTRDRETEPEIARAARGEFRFLSFSFLRAQKEPTRETTGRQARNEKENKGDAPRLGPMRDVADWLVAVAAATQDLLLRSMGLKCFNRHGSLRRGHSASREISTFRPDCLSPARQLFRSGGGGAARRGVHRSPMVLSPVIARNHTRGRYERNSADAHFFPSPPRFDPREQSLHTLLSGPSPQHLPPRRLLSRSSPVSGTALFPKAESFPR